MNARKRRYACINEKTCVACGECEYVCPRGAAKVMNGTTAVVGSDLCVGCGLCAAGCPTGSIQIIKD